MLFGIFTANDLIGELALSADSWVIPAFREGIDMPEGRAVGSEGPRQAGGMHFQESHQPQQRQIRSLVHAGDELTEEQLCRKGPVVLVDTMSMSWQLRQTRSASSHISLASCNQQV